MDWRYNTIWFEQIDAEKKIQWDFKKDKKIQLRLTREEYLIAWYLNCKEQSIAQLPESDNLLYLELNWANIDNFRGLSKFPNLKRLELHYCTKLSSDRGLNEILTSIEHLHINQSKKLDSIIDIAQLTNLKVLRLNSCGPLKSISFIKDLPNLIDFRFVDTSVLDGDLTPIIEHPALRTAGFSNKRNFNYNSEKLATILNLKSNVEYKEFAFKGQYKTFRYI